MLEICFDTFCEHGPENTGMEKLSKACGISNAALVCYFGSKDNIIIEATAHCMAKVEQDFMAKAPQTRRILSGFCGKCPI